MSGTGITQTLVDFHELIRGRIVTVKLISGDHYRGFITSLDAAMNIAMEDVEEYLDGQLRKTYGQAFIRGNNVLYIEAFGPKEETDTDSKTGEGAFDMKALVALVARRGKKKKRPRVVKEQEKRTFEKRDKCMHHDPIP